MTEPEIKNCKDYVSAQKIVKDWNKEDFDYGLSLDDYDGKMYYWNVGYVRTRAVRRRNWRDLILKKK
jgi:hypothetical protein